MPCLESCPASSPDVKERREQAHTALETQRCLCHSKVGQARGGSLLQHPVLVHVTRMVSDPENLYCVKRDSGKQEPFPDIRIV